jgi:lipoprotein-anchoring transpeptidase ErfK/SrfK
MICKVFVASGVLWLVAAATPASAELDPATVNAADFSKAADGKWSQSLILKLQILLDRAHMSPGVIDGRMGESTEQALRAFEKKWGLPTDGRLDPQTWAALDRGGTEVLMSYETTQEDLAGPFVDKVPEDFAEMAKMERLSYTGVAELLAEKFHTDPELLAALNPGARFDRPGGRIYVPNIRVSVDDKVEKVELDKSEGVLRGYGSDGALLVAYPATIGSGQNPSPSGDMTVKGIAKNPKYEYRPEKNFQQDDNDEPLTLPPGPNGPVGSIWIELSEETYGIHGTADPELIGKSVSHGCVRLTNWDAQELGRLVKPGTQVRFVE